MRLAFVQSYPAYHDGHDLETWRSLRNRDRLMPAVAAALGHQVELLAVSTARESFASRGPGVEGYRIELFPADSRRGPSRGHASRELLAHARDGPADLYFVKGIDGGAGLQLARQHLLPRRIPFALVVGGKYYNRLVSEARFVLYETALQRARLERPGWRIWRAPIPPGRLLKLPKSVDTDTFRPTAAQDKVFDVMMVGRLVRWKSFDALGALDPALRLAVVGGGPEEARLRARLPAVAWLGRQDPAGVARHLARARLLYVPGLNDHYPRVVAEAFACGVPVVAVRGGVSPDAIPEGTGLLVRAREAPRVVRELVADTARLERMGRAARDHALRELGKGSSRGTLLEVLARLEAGPSAT